jgi:tetratricopeptide (TPR) repeat protein
MKPSPEDVREALAKVLASPDFSSAGRLGPFLAHLVGAALAGETDRLKESVLGVEFFDRGSDYDPRLDPVVRIEARRLRLRLEKYYASEGASDQTRIDLPKGGYIPSFAIAASEAATISRRWPYWVSAAMVVICVASVFAVYQRISPADAPSDPARIAFERGRYQMNLYSQQGMERAIAYFNESLSHNPRYAPPLAYLSQVYALLTYYNSLPEGVPSDKARELAEQAIQADPNLAEAHAAMGFVLAAQQYRWKDGEEEFRKALNLNPDSGLTHGLYGLAILAPQGRPETLSEFRRALELDPNSSFINFVYGFALLASGDAAAAVKQYERTLELENVHPDMLWDYGMALGYAGRHNDARQAFLRHLKVTGQAGSRLTGLQAYFAGDPGRCRSDLPQTEKLVMAGREDRMDLVRQAAMCGDPERAFRWLERAIDARETQAIWLRVDPRLKPLRGDPRFKPLAARLGL